MLRGAIYYYKQFSCYRLNFGKWMSLDEYLPIINRIYQKELIGAKEVKIGSQAYFRFRINYYYDPAHLTTLYFVTDLTDDPNKITKLIKNAHKEFIDLFGSILGDDLNPDDFEILKPSLYAIHKGLKPKISIIGYSGVGKTTITRLITDQDIPMDHVPTISGEIGWIKIGNLVFALWDFAGQEHFDYLWTQFLHGSDGILLITDSTKENVEKSKFFVDLIQKEAPDAHIAVIGNKQDLPEALPVTEITKILNRKAYSFIAIEPEHKVKMMNIIADILEIEASESELFKPLVIRNKLLDEAEKAIQNGDLNGAANAFDQLSNYCIELGDDTLAQDCYNKSKSIRNKLKELGTSYTSPVQTTTTTPEINKNSSQPVAAPVGLPPPPPAGVPVGLPPPPVQMPIQPPPIDPAPITAPVTEIPSGQPTITPQVSHQLDETQKQAMISEYKEKLAQVNGKISEYAIQMSTGQITVQEMQEKVAKLNALRMKIEEEMRAIPNS